MVFCGQPTGGSLLDDIGVRFWGSGAAFLHDARYAIKGYIERTDSRHEVPRLPGNVIDGKKIGDDVRTELKPRLTRLADAGGAPGLAAGLVGENPASQLYAKVKRKAHEEMGMARRPIGL